MLEVYLNKISKMKNAETERRETAQNNNPKPTTKYDDKLGKLLAHNSNSSQECE